MMIRIKLRSCVLLAIGLLATLQPLAALPAYPGAISGADDVRGGRAGRVVLVTNLQDAGEGSLRAALEAAGPRMVLFRVSGRVELSSPVVIDKPYLTVAGGSAPGTGIIISGAEVVVDTTQVILRDLTFHWTQSGEAEQAVRQTDRAAQVVLGDCRFVKRLEGKSARVRSLIPAVDSDNDGMPDAFERRHGFDHWNPRFGVFDANGNGYTNLEEYLNGRDPTVRQSKPEAAPGTQPGKGPNYVLEAEDFARHVEFFNSMEPERVVNLVPNAESWDWLKERIPLFESSDADAEEIYYFRWWALRKHLKMVGEYPVYTEFIELDTKAKFIPPERTIASALGHHFMETRWLRDQQYDNAYLDYWMVGKDGGPQSHFHQYSSWLTESLWQRHKVINDADYLIERFDRLYADYRRWQDEKQRDDGLYWQYDVWDAMEESISGSRTEKNVRPTINSYMYGNALALAEMARLAGRPEVAQQLEAEAAELRRLLLHAMWNRERQFFEVVKEDGSFADVREAIGFIPWYFNIPEPGKGYEVAWEQALDTEGFWAPYGFTTAERRHPRFRSHGTGTCEWDGAVWPYATSQTLGAMANVLREYPASPLSQQDYFDAFQTYTRSQRFESLPYIGEYQEESTGYWLKGRDPRSYYYHHSTYADLLITGIVGLRPRADNILEVHPLLPETEWSWFCLDGVYYRGHSLTILWDREGDRYGYGAGLHVLVDGKLLMQSDGLNHIQAELPK